MILWPELWILKSIDEKWQVSHVTSPCGWYLHFINTLYSFFVPRSDNPRYRFSPTSPLALPSLPLSSSMQIKLGGTVLGPGLFMSIISRLNLFSVSFTALTELPVYNIYQWVVSPTHGSIIM